MAIELSQEQKDQLVGGGECFLHSHTPDQITGLVELVLQEAPIPDPIAPGTYLEPANNLSDVASTATARTNLGLGTAAPANLGHSAGNAVPAGGANGALTIGTNDATALALRTNNSERLRINSSGNVGIGTSSPTSKLTIQSGNLELKGVVQQVLFNTNTPANNYWIAANISDSVQDGLYIGKGGNGGGIGTAGAQNIIKIDASGNVLVTGSGGLGYGVGSGGTVTQATSKSTAVTLNKPCGRITMNSAALASGASVIFAVLNSTVTSTDTVVLSLAGTNSYSVECNRVGGGSFTVRLTNITAGSLSDAVIVGFTIIKGAVS